MRNRNRNRYESPTPLVVVRGEVEVECRIVGTVLATFGPRGLREYEVEAEAVDVASGEAVPLLPREEYEAEALLIDQHAQSVSEARERLHAMREDASEQRAEWFI